MRVIYDNEQKTGLDDIEPKNSDLIVSENGELYRKFMYT